MSVLDLASVARTSAGYTTLSALDAFPEYVDSDNHTRALAQRDSDGAVVVVFASGAHVGIVDTYNERSRVNHERSAAKSALADMRKQWEPAEVPDDDADAAELAATVMQCEEALGALARVRSTPTLHVARALTHYERAATEEASEPVPDLDESESGE